MAGGARSRGGRRSGVSGRKRYRVELAPEVVLDLAAAGRQVALGSIVAISPASLRRCAIRSWSAWRPRKKPSERPK